MNLFGCIQCGSVDYDPPLFRGLCPTCAPELHAAWKASRDLWARRSEAFKAATGREPLEDWEAFKRFVDAGLTP